MQRRTFLSMTAAGALAAKPGAWRPLFDGKSLEGWVEDTPGLWSVRDGMIVGKHTGQKWNDFLRTKEQFENFELSLEFRLLDNVGNSGIQFRSVPAAQEHELSGYQADIGQKYWGCLYDESRRRRILGQAPAEFIEKLDKGAWHTYTIRAEGVRVVMHLDGTQTVDYTEAETGLVQRGVIALQVHAGTGMEVWFRKIKVREL
jgi:hypothetical protein